MEIEQSRRERKKDETRQRIFREAIGLFRERGFEQTTVDEITERADVARGTFFNYFPRKDAVLAYLSEQRLVEAETDAGEILAAERSAREKLIAIYTGAAAAYEEEKDLAEFILPELLRRAFTPVEEIGSRWDAIVLQVFEQGQKAGEIAPDVDPQRAIAVLTSVYYATLFMWVHCPEAATFHLQDEVRARFDMVFAGLASETRPGGASIHGARQP
jgi:AcrR family transcriptional regulator